jgi:hypothetical protein
MFTLESAMGILNRYLQCAWKICEPGHCGYITLEHEGGVPLFSFCLLIEGVWKHLSFRKYNVDTGIYQAASSGRVIEVVMEEGDPRPRLQFEEYYSS